MAPQPLKNYRILVSDSDIELAKVLRKMLSDMGFIYCDLTTSGAEAYEMLSGSPYDFLITEWNTKQMDGITLLKKIRRDPRSPNPTLPVIMLTGRAELPDVFTARDYGINEFVVKPFTAKAIYNRIERIIENPRAFVVSSNFVGPDRRAKGTPPPGVEDRRVRKVQPQLQPKDVLGAMQNPQLPRVWLPDFSLKYKLGNNVKLDSLITPAVLNQAQAAIDAISDASLEWIKENIKHLRTYIEVLNTGSFPANIMQTIGEEALEVNSRAGTFGYSRASEIAYQLYLFCNKHTTQVRKEHVTIIQKHVEVLQVILGNQMRGSAGAMGQQAIDELKRLTEKIG